jgi:hypothetical protein
VRFSTAIAVHGLSGSCSTLIVFDQTHSRTCFGPVNTTRRSVITAVPLSIAVGLSGERT